MSSTHSLNGDSLSVISCNLYANLRTQWQHNTFGGNNRIECARCHPHLFWKVLLHWRAVTHLLILLESLYSGNGSPCGLFWNRFWKCSSPKMRQLNLFYQNSNATLKGNSSIGQPGCYSHIFVHNDHLRCRDLGNTDNGKNNVQGRGAQASYSFL